MTTSTVRVGVGCFVVRPNGDFITGVRKGSHGAGCVQLPGGHLEVGESFAGCAEREVLEECGIDLRVACRAPPEFVTATNDIFAIKHYVTVFVVARLEQDVEPTVMEPDKCESWRWTSWNQLVEMATSSGTGPEVFLPLRNLVQQRPDVDPTRV
ncbi:hypothetical protein JCM11491_006388 [Sporobolomyces phaffii]